jgi:hypothetical protein
MMKPSGAHTHPGGGGTGGAVLVVLAVIVAAAVARPVIDALAELVRLVLIAVAVTGGLALAGGTAFVVYRVRHRGAVRVLPVPRAHPVTWQAAEPLPAPQRPAIEAPREVHLHFHGVSAEDVAELLARVNRDHG